MDSSALFDRLETALAVIGPDWRVTEWSATAGRLTGVPRALAVGQGFWEVFPVARGGQLERELAQVRADGRTRRVLAPSASADHGGIVFEVEAAPAPDQKLAVLFRHLTDTAVALPAQPHISAAFESEHRLRASLFSLLPAPAFILTAAGAVAEANAAAAALLNVDDPREVKFRPFGDWIPRLNWPTLAREALRAPQRVTLFFEVGSQPVLEVDAVLTHVAAPAEPATYLCLVTSPTRELLLQRQLLQSDRLSQLGALLSGVAHELNNPLTAIAAFADSMNADMRAADLADSARIVQLEATRAGRMVRTLLDFVRQRPRTPEPVLLQEALSRVLVLHKNALRRSRVTVEAWLPGDLPRIWVDPRDLQQILLNGVINAQHAIESTGRAGKVTVGAKRTGRHVTITIEDDGPGVPPEILDRVFEPFVSTAGKEGMGLGLPISFGLARASGGRMWIQNLEGGGARLSFELPTDQSEGKIPASGDRRRRRAAHSLSVLVVDDDPGVLRAMSLLTERLGHRATAVASLEEALDRLSSGTRYDAVLADVHLDGPHSGFEILDVLRHERRGLERSLVFTTGDWISREARDRLTEADRPVLKKPFGIDELREVLDRVA